MILDSLKGCLLLHVRNELGFEVQMVNRNVAWDRREGFVSYVLVFQLRLYP